MKRSDRDTLLLEKLLGKYEFVKPVPADAREIIISSKKEILVRVLKTVGVFSALYGVLLTVQFSLKKILVGIPLAKFIISGITVTSLSYGGYYLYTTRAGIHTPAATHPAKSVSLKDIQAKYKWVDQIILYNGKTIQGAITSRGAMYEVLTTEGIIRIPRKQIKMVRPLKLSEDEKTAPMADESKKGK